MSKKLIMLILVLFFFAPILFSFAEEIRVVLNVNGQKCQHLHITDMNGTVLEVSTEAQIMEKVSETDSSLMKQIKPIIQEMIKGGVTDIKLIKTELEKRGAFELK